MPQVHSLSLHSCRVVSPSRGGSQSERAGPEVQIQLCLTQSSPFLPLRPNQRRPKTVSDLEIQSTSLSPVGDVFLNVLLNHRKGATYLGLPETQGETHVKCSFNRAHPHLPLGCRRPTPAPDRRPERARRWPRSSARAD